MVTDSERARLEALFAARGSSEKHLSRADLLTADRVGAVGIMTTGGQVQKPRVVLAERFIAEGVDGLLRDKTRPPDIAPLETVPIVKVVC